MKKAQPNGLNKNRLLFFLLLAVVFLFFVNDYSLVTADKIAIVVAIGVDEAENGEYEVSAEVAIPPSASGESSSESDQTVLSAKGHTIAEAVSNLFLETGWYPKLNYCNLILLSEKIAQKGAMVALEYFLRSETVMDSAVVVIARGDSAKTILETSTPLDNISAFSLQKIAFERYVNYSDVVTSNLKDFTKKYYDFGVGSVLASVKLSSYDAESSEESKQSTLNGRFGLFDMTYSALFFGDKLTGYLDDEQTKAFNFLKKDVTGSTFEVKSERSGELEKDFTLEIIRQKTDISPKLVGSEIVCDVDVALKVKISDTDGTNSSLIDVTTSYELPRTLKKEAERQLEETFEGMLNALSSANCDGLAVGKSLNAFEHRAWERFLTAENFEEYAKAVRYRVNVSVEGLSGEN